MLLLSLKTMYNQTRFCQTRTVYWLPKYKLNGVKITAVVVLNTAGYRNKSIKMHASTSKGIVGSFQVTLTSGSKEIWEKRYRKDEALRVGGIYFFIWLIKTLITGYLDYFSKLSRAIMSFFSTNFLETAVSIQSTRHVTLCTLCLTYSIDHSPICRYFVWVIFYCA